jgi:endonuclease/exonuclease/phosphatase (EEP) superfamily protein YafD
VTEPKSSDAVEPVNRRIPATSESWTATLGQLVNDIVSTVATDNPDALVVFGGDLNDTPGSEPIAALDEKLVRPSLGLPNDTIATYFFEGTGEPIDHLYTSSATHIVAGTFAVDKDPGSRTFAGSDHAAVHADFD